MNKTNRRNEIATLRIKRNINRGPETRNEHQKEARIKEMMMMMIKKEGGKTIDTGHNKKKQIESSKKIEPEKIY